MKELIKICKKANKTELLKIKEVKSKIQDIEKRLSPFGIDCNCKNDLDYYNLQILDIALKNKSEIEQAYEALARDMFEIWEYLDYKKRNEFAFNALKEMKDQMISFDCEDKRILIPFFDELLNVLYDKDTAVLQLPQFFKLYKSFKEKMIDPFVYFDKPYSNGFVNVQFLGANEKGFGFYETLNHSIYVLNKQKEVVVLPLSLSKKVDELDPVRATRWIEAVLEQDNKAMVQWCINCGQLEEDVKKKCINLLKKIG